MKRKTLFVVALSLLACVFVGCAENAPKKEAEVKAGNATECLVGTWTVVENSFAKSFTFNANNTGTEVQAADDVRSFTWSIKDEKPTVVYVSETTEWQFTLSCERNQLTVFGLVYTKL